ncbi:MAG TPA: T9SS type A sorting domain-containing protein [Puia sp.]|nr:T9SS type A sorting domain-containing protein [Puia sp.]
MKKICCLGLMLISIYVKAGSCAANGTGDWETNGTWSCGHAPGTADNVTIGAGMTVTVNANNLADIGNLDIFGTLQFTNGSKIDLASASLVNIYSGGSITGGNSGAKLVFPSTSYAGPFSTTGPFYFSNSGSGSGLLPLTLVSFYSSQQNQHVVLNWRTENEENIKSFEIESRENGNSVWQPVGMIPSMSVSEGGYLYTFIDQTKTNGDRYYHLKIIYYDGQYDYSKVLFVTSAQTAAISLMPTMANSSIHVSLPTMGQAEISIFNTSGQLVKTLITGSEVFNIDVSKLGMGEYFLKASQRNNSYTAKFLKQ